MDVQPPLVSVITPAYNRPAYLREALQSILRQTYPHFEVIVSDNASTEDLGTVVQAFDDPRIRYHRQATNIGAFRNSMWAVRQARGKYLAYLHDDDQWEPAFLERLLPPLEADANLSIAFSDHYLIDQDGTIDHAGTEQNTRRWQRHRLNPGTHRPFYRIALVDRSVPASMAAVIRTSAIDWSKIPPASGPAYDLWITYLACRDGRGAYYCPERLTRYRTHNGCQTNTNMQRFEGVIYCYEQFLKDPDLAAFSASFRSVSGDFQTGWGLALLRLARRREARRHLWMGFRRRPGLRAMAALGMSLLPDRWTQSLFALRSRRPAPSLAAPI